MKGLPKQEVNESGLVAPAPVSPPTFHWIATSPGTAFPAKRGEPGPGHPGIPLDVFAAAVTAARRRIWIIDRHFAGWCGLAQLLDAYPSAPARLKAGATSPEARILTCRAKEAWAWLGAAKKRLPNRVMIANLRDDASVHDRFALVDDDLWHFGSTVGGAHPAVSAATRGWAAEVTPFENLFRSMWQRAAP